MMLGKFIARTMGGTSSIHANQTAISHSPFAISKANKLKHASKKFRGGKIFTITAMVNEGLVIGFIALAR